MDEDGDDRGLRADKNLALCRRLVWANHPGGKMSLYLMAPRVKRVYFQVYFLENRKSNRMVYLEARDPASGLRKVF